MATFKLVSKYKPAGDQPKAIKALTQGLKKDTPHQTLLGVTGSGKTFTVANVIEKIGKPTLVIAHNKTLAAQLAQEYKEFFPDAAVHYFVSYYDFYQPEAYMPTTDTYIEKDAQVNEEIDRLRHATTQALLTRRDVIVVASVSCIYGLGSPIEYEKVNLKLSVGDKVSRADLVRKLVGLYYERKTGDLTPGHFRALGNVVEIMPANERIMVRVELSSSAIERMVRIDPVSHTVLGESKALFIFPAKHFVTPEEETKRALKDIELELNTRLKELKKEGKLLEPERLKRRTRHDISMIREVGYVSGVENYSRHFDGRSEGEPPYTLLDYFSYGRGHTQNGRRHTQKKNEADFLTIIDESHVTVPQIGGMYAGDRSRKQTLIEHGFRLPSALDNRPLRFEEFEERIGQVIYTSATPGGYELEKSASDGVVEQIIRPTGLVDPEVEVLPIQPDNEHKGQVQDVMVHAQEAVKKGNRAMITTLTKKMAEDLTDYLKDKKMKAAYLHSDIKTIERIEILTAFRKGEFDVLVGVNLLREGLDLPEVSFIGILDADKEGFLRSETSLIQIIGRAARNVEGKVILYADTVTGSMERAIGETNRRRTLQLAYNKKHGITPKTIKKEIRDITEELTKEHHKTAQALLSIDEQLFKKNPKKFIAAKKKKMEAAVKILDFESAAILRDEIALLMEKLKTK